MKKTFITIIVAFCITTMVGCTAASTPETTTGQTSSAQSASSSIVTGSAAQAQSASSSAGYIGADTAKTIALEHAALTESDVTFIKAELDFENGREVYDVEFYSGNIEYDYEIDAYTGSILSYDTDIENYAINSNGSQPQNSAQTGSRAANAAAAYIGEDSAKAIALETAGVAQADATFTKVKLDYENGIAVYDIEFVAGNTEYELEINATTGAVMEYRDHPEFCVNLRCGVE